MHVKKNNKEVSLEPTDIRAAVQCSCLPSGLLVQALFGLAVGLYSQAGSANAQGAVFAQAMAQGVPDAGSLRQQIEQQRTLPLPQAAPAPRVTPPPEIKAPSGMTVRPQSFRFVGNTLLNSEQLAPSLSEFVDRELDFAGLQRAADAVAATVLVGLMGSLLGNVAHAQTAPPPNQLPTGAQLSAGNASINQSGTHMLINQSTDRAAFNWQSFNVGKDAHVQFQQPSAASVTLNRVMSSDPSQIFGRITANGQVILTNPAGVYFGKDARVDVGGLVATTHGVSDADFMAGKNRFERNGATGSVVNEGELKAALGGYIALLAPEVRNHGAVIAQMGTVALAAGEAIDLKFDSHTQTGALNVAGASNLSSTNGSITPSNPANDFGGAVNANGANIALSDVNSLKLGTVKIPGNVMLASNGPLDLGTLTAGGTLTANSGNGNITQSGAVKAGGLANFKAGAGTVTLTQPGNSFPKGTQVQAASFVIAGDARKSADEAAQKVQGSLPTMSMAGKGLSNAAAPAPLVLASSTAAASTSGSSSSSSAAVTGGSSNSTGVVFDVQGVDQQATPAMVAVSLPKGASTSGTGFSFALPESVKTQIQDLASAQANLPNGAPLPAWLSFDAQGLRFEAKAVPDGAFPMQVALRVGDKRILVVISERLE